MAIPIGTVVAYSCSQMDSMSESSETWLPCDGKAYARDDYTDLFGVIGGSFGTNGTTDFHVPDLQGLFIRSRNDGQTDPIKTDPDAATREATPNVPNGNTGDLVGSYQADCVAWHSHSLENTWGAYSCGDQTVKGECVSCSPQSVTQTNPTSETRPNNAAFAFFILADNPQSRLPLNSVVAFASDEAPADHSGDGDTWVKCNGQNNSPDLRGVFLRGVGTGEQVGTFQADVFSSHQHLVLGDDSVQHDGGGGQVLSANNDGGGSAGNTDSAGPGMGAETRPKNLYLYHIMRTG